MSQWNRIAARPQRVRGVSGYQLLSLLTLMVLGGIGLLVQKARFPDPTSRPSAHPSPSVDYQLHLQLQHSRPQEPPDCSHTLDFDGVLEPAAPARPSTALTEHKHLLHIVQVLRVAVMTEVGWFMLLWLVHRIGSKAVMEPSWRQNSIKQLGLAAFSTLATILIIISPSHPMFVYVIARGCVYAGMCLSCLFHGPPAMGAPSLDHSFVQPVDSFANIAASHQASGPAAARGQGETARLVSHVRSTQAVTKQAVPTPPLATASLKSPPQACTPLKAASKQPSSQPMGHPPFQTVSRATTPGNGFRQEKPGKENVPTLPSHAPPESSPAASSRTLSEPAFKGTASDVNANTRAAPPLHTLYSIANGNHSTPAASVSAKSPADARGGGG